MLRKITKRLQAMEHAFVRGWGRDIDTPAGRRAAMWHFYLADHAFLRGLWTNQDEIAPGVWRSNQPSPARLRKLKAMGIRSILNLRGGDGFSYHLFENECCENLGINLISHKIYARKLVSRDVMMPLFDIFDRIEKPFVMHCKSGADRAGLASALWLLDQEGASIEDAKKMLSFRYVHLKFTKTGLMDHVIEAYEADTRTDPMPVREWFATKYDPVALTETFFAKKGKS